MIGLDANDAGSGAAGRNGGLLLAGLANFYHESIKEIGHELTLAMYKETLVELDNVFNEFPEHCKRVGSLRIASTIAEIYDCKQQYQAMRHDNLPVELYSGTEGKGLFFPTDGVMNPLDRVRAMARKAINEGAQLYGQAKVIEVSGRRVTIESG